MNLPYFISKKISKAEKGSFSATINKVAIASIALGLATMLVSFLILGGFKKEVMNKIFAFSGNIQVTRYSLDNTLQEEPISTQNVVYQHPDSFNFIHRVETFAHKAGLLQTEEEVYGAFMKGVNEDADSLRFINTLEEGGFIRFPEQTEGANAYSLDILISRKIANTLKLSVGDGVRMYFIDPPDPPRIRKLNVRGIYNTSIEEFDEQVIIGDIALIQRLNNWPDTLVGGFEIFLKEEANIDKAAEELRNELDYDLYVEKINDRYVQMFEWLELINNNVVVFLGLILFVACFNIVSILLILIMERTQMIGVLKALGAKNSQIRRIFTYNGLILISKGMLAGNFIGLGFGALQYYFKVIPLDPENYYMEFVPIQWDLLSILLLNLLTFIIVGLVLNIPTAIIMRIHPIRAIRFD